jgi:hypothetical protein
MNWYHKAAIFHCNLDLHGEWCCRNRHILGGITPAMLSNQLEMRS